MHQSTATEVTTARILASNSIVLAAQPRSFSLPKVAANPRPLWISLLRRLQTVFLTEQARSPSFRTTATLIELL